MVSAMRFLLLAAALLATPALAPAWAQAPARPGPVTTLIGAAQATSSGQPVLLPQGPVQVTLSETTLAPGGALPAHKHPYPRYAYLLAGRLQVTNLDTGKTFDAKAGELVLDPVDQWHEAKVMGDEAVRLLTFDQTPPGAAAIIRREP